MKDFSSNEIKKVFFWGKVHLFNKVSNQVVLFVLPLSLGMIFQSYLKRSTGKSKVCPYVLCTKKFIIFLCIFLITVWKKALSRKTSLQDLCLQSRCRRKLLHGIKIPTTFPFRNTTQSWTLGWEIGIPTCEQIWPSIWPTWYQRTLFQSLYFNWRYTCAQKCSHP